MFSLVRNNVVSARRCVPVISFVGRPILRILVTERRDFLISGITTTRAFASVVCFPTRFGASRFLSFMMFQIMTEFARRVSFQFNMTHGTFFIYASVLFTSCCNVNNPIAWSMSGRGNGLVCRICATVTFASVICFPTRFGASRIFFVMMFKVMTKCRYICLCNDNCVANRAMLAFGFTFFSASWGNCIINNFRMTECGNLLISSIATTFALASVVCFPTNLCASCIFFIMMFNVVTKRRYIGLCNDNRVANRAMLAFGFAFFSTCRSNCIINNFRMAESRNYGLFLQDCSANRAVLSLCESRGCACWINRIVYHFNVIAYVFLPFHVNINVFGQSRCLQGFKRSAYRQLSVEIVANDMISVFRYGRNIGGDIPNYIILSVVRVYGNFKTRILRADFIASGKNARQNDRHCQNG